MTSSTTQTEPVDVGCLEYLRSLSTSLDTLRHNATLTDVYVECESRKFPAHRLVLSAVSPYFKTAFDKTSTAVLPCTVNAQSMDTILEFLYRGNVHDITGDDYEMTKLLEASHYLQINDLVTFSYNVLADRHLTTSNFYELYDYVVNLDDSYCLLQMTSFLVRNFADVSKSNDFLLLRGGMLKSVIECEDLYRHPLEDVIMGILNWIEFENEREKYLTEFLLIFQKRCCCECLQNTLEKKNTSWSAVVTEAVDTLRASIANVLDKDLATKGPKLYCFGKSEDRQVMRFLDVENYKWLPCRYLPFQLESDMATISLRDHVYFFGGRGDIDKNVFTPSNTIVQYCIPSNKVVESGQCLPFPVFQAGAGVLNGRIYVVNGRNGSNTPTLNIVQCYNIKECSWGMTASTQEPHTMPYVFSFNQFLYAIGSYLGDMNCMEYYDPASDQWTIVTLVPGGLYYHKAVFCNSKVFVVKEYSDAEYRIYDMCSNKWLLREFPGRPEQIKGLWSINRNGKLLLVVCDRGNVLHTYDVEKECWVEPISQPKDGQCEFVYLIQNQCISC